MLSLRITTLLALLSSLALQTSAKPVKTTTTVQHAFSHLSPLPSSLHQLTPLQADAITSVLASTTVSPLDLYLHLDPSAREAMEEPRYLLIFGEEVQGPRWMTEGDKLVLKRDGKGFMDLTGREGFGQAEEAMSLMGKGKDVPSYPANSSYASLITPLFKHLSYHSAYDALEKGSGFYNRHYQSVTGQQSSEWLFDELSAIIAKRKSGVTISIESIPHEFLQNSIIVRFSPARPHPRQAPGAPNPIPEQGRFPHWPVVILGAHQDSANYLFPLLPSPGADDDLSGTVTLLEAFRVMVERGFKPLDKVVEFHWYAAEEGGLLGSLDIVDLYVQRGVDVHAMMEYDMTAYVKIGSEPKINLITNNSTRSLNEFTLRIADEYTDEPAQMSDLLLVVPGSSLLPFVHESWLTFDPPRCTSALEREVNYMSFQKAGFPASFATEADPMAKGLYNPYVHTVMDKMSIPEFSIDHMLQFSRLAIAWSVELAGWDQGN